MPGDVGQIRGDQVEAGGQRGEQVGLDKTDAAWRVARCIGCGHGQRAGRHVNGDHFGGRQSASQADGDTAAARAHVDDSHRLPVFPPGHGRLHQLLRLGSGDEH